MGPAGVASTNDTAYFSWSDSRRGTLETPVEDYYFTTARFGGTKSTSTSLTFATGVATGLFAAGVRAGRGVVRGPGQAPPNPGRVGAPPRDGRFGLPPAGQKRSSSSHGRSGTRGTRVRPRRAGQEWRVTSLHWRYDPAFIRTLVPPGLRSTPGRATRG